MKKSVRDFIFVVFIVVFIIAGLITSLYASGYRFNLTWPLRPGRILAKTGMLIIDSQPQQAAILLDGEVLKDNSFLPWRRQERYTPAKIKNLLPGEYELRLEREGYWPYQQKIRIVSGETTFAEYINLFKEDQAMFVSAATSSSLSLSPDRRFLYGADGQLIDLRSSDKRAVASSTGSSWLTNGKLFISGRLYDPYKPQSDRSYLDVVGSGVTVWHYDEESGDIYYVNKDALNRLSANGRNRLLLSGRKLIDFLPSGDQVFLLSEEKEAVNLELYSQDQEKVIGAYALPKDGQYSFLPMSSGYLKVLDARHRSLYVFPQGQVNSEPLVIRQLASQVQSGDMMIYATDYEIWRVDLRSGRSDLLTRRSQMIKQILWHQGGDYLIIAGDKSLSVYDLKAGLSTDLLSVERLGQCALDERQDLLYFFARRDKQEGIYKISLQ